VRSILTAQPTSRETITITDMEAGIEHLSRGTTRASDVLLIIAEPYFKSLETASRVKQMADDLGIPHVYVVANKVRTEADAQAIQAFCQKQGLSVLATIPYDDKVSEASMLPQSPLDHCPDSAGVQAVTELTRQLASLHLN
jgi:CO dehydrogenase maturation factor